MLDINEIDGTRIGKFELSGKTFDIPALLRIEKDIMMIGDLQIPRPLSYPFRSVPTEGTIKVNSYLRINRAVTSRIADKIQGKNIELQLDGDITPVFLSGDADLNKEFIESLNEASIFLFDSSDERELLKSFFSIRKKYPNSLCFCNCGPDLIPVLAYAGFDLFPDTAENRDALTSYLENRTPHYVEMSSCATLRAKTILNLLYLDHWMELEGYLKISKEKELFISRDAFWRPCAQMWEKMIKSNYVPQSNVFLLLPCSAKKPYSSSKSHRRFINIIKSKLGNNYSSLCQLIVTSPYGVVPRELEGLIDYDIVVTGRWMGEEIDRSREMLKSIISKSKDPIVLAHLPENELESIEGIGVEARVTSVGHPLSDESIDKLKSELQTINGLFTHKVDKYHDLRTQSKFIFGNDILPEKIGIRGRGVKQVFSNGNIIASLGKRIRPMYKDVKVQKKWVNIDFDIKGDLFCVGVRDADNGIRAGDDVIIRKDKETTAIGTAILPGKMMKKMRKGKAVKVRKRL